MSTPPHQPTNGQKSRRGAVGRATAHVLPTLRRDVGIVVLCIAVAAAVAFVLSNSRPKVYESTAVLLFKPSVADQNLFTNSATPRPDAGREAATDLGLASLDTVAARTAQRLGGTWSLGGVKDAVNVVAAGDSNLVRVTAADRRPQRAAEIANVYATQYVIFRRESDQRSVDAALRLVGQELAALEARDSSEAADDATSLRRREQQLKIVRSLQTGNVEIAQGARASSTPSSPRPKRDAALAGLAGGLIGVLLVVVLLRTDRTVRGSDEAAEIIGRPLLATFPASPAKATPAELAGKLRMAAQLLRANLLFFSIDRDVRTILVTSSGAGEGKSTVAISLAFAGAEAGQRVLLVEADLRRPTLAGRVEAEPGAGLSQVLNGSATFAEAVKTVGVPFANVGQDDAQSWNVDVLTAGAQPPNPADLVGSAQFRSLLEELGAQYDLIVIDTPPVSVVPDAVPLLAHVDGVLLVCRVNRTKTSAFQALAQQLGLGQTNVLGVVANAAPTSDSTYDGYNHYYASTPS